MISSPICSVIEGLSNIGVSTVIKNQERTRDLDGLRPTKEVPEVLRHSNTNSGPIPMMSSVFGSGRRGL